jgi:hypothetical protein
MKAHCSSAFPLSIVPAKGENQRYSSAEKPSRDGSEDGSEINGIDG